MAANNDDDNADATEMESLDEEKDPYNDSTESVVDGAKSDSISERKSRNEMEKKRRTRLKRSLDGLQETLPALRGKKVSTAQVLKEATDFIVRKQLENEVSRKEVEEMQRQNDELERKCRALEREKGVEHMCLEFDEASPTKQPSDNP